MVDAGRIDTGRVDVTADAMVDTRRVDITADAMVDT